MRLMEEIDVGCCHDGDNTDNTCITIYCKE